MEDKDCIELSLADIQPVILRSARNVLQPGFRTGIRVIPHYQIQYIQEGRGSVSIGGETHAAARGMLFFWGPGTRHSIESDTKDPLVILGAQFHLSPAMKPVRFFDFGGFPPAVRIRTQARVESVLMEMAREYREQRRYWQQAAGSLCKTFLLWLARLDAGSASGRALENADLILQFIHERYMEPLTVGAIAKHFHFHPSHVNKLVMNATGRSTHQYLLHVRMNQAVELLHSTNLSVKEIAAMVGCPNLPYFSRLFKKKIGISPSDLRRNAGNG